MILGVLVVAVVIALSTVSDRLGIAPPLILMLVGVGISFLPFMRPFAPEPEWILAGILPPLLYAAAISIPTVELRRDFSAVGGLAVILVVLSAGVLGFIFHWLIPGVSLPLGIALGAILSPTDAAATTIVKRLGVPGRVGTILQGESLLNDATALVLLRSAIAATAAAVSFWGVVLDFLWAALAAVVIGVVVGWVGVRVRKLVHNSAPATAISLLLPFVAYVPAEMVHASGLVAVVAAGITSAQLGPKHLDARQRIAERANWHTLEFLLEGAVFLMMGMELHALIDDVQVEHDSLWLAAGMAGLAIVVTLVVRGGYIAFLLRGISARTSRKVRRRDTMTKARETIRTTSQLVQQHFAAIDQYSQPGQSDQPSQSDQPGQTANPLGMGEANPPYPADAAPAGLSGPVGAVPADAAVMNTAGTTAAGTTAADSTAADSTGTGSTGTDLPAAVTPDIGSAFFTRRDMRRGNLPGRDVHDVSRELLSRRPDIQAHLESMDPAVHARMRDRYEQLRTHIKRYFADVDYLIHQPLGFKEGVLLTWAGMRGVVTLAAAQTLPSNSPHRSLLILIAFFVAAGSLVIQGGSLSWVVKKLGLAGQDSSGSEEWPELKAELDDAGNRAVSYRSADATDNSGSDSQQPGKWYTADGKPIPENQVPLARIRAERQALLVLRSTGTYSSTTLSTALAELDAEEMSIQLRLSGED